MRRISSSASLILITGIAFVTYSIICLLFAPFDESTWFAIGFCFFQSALLAYASLAKRKQGSKSLFKVYPSIYIASSCTFIQAVFGLIAAVWIQNPITIIAVGIVLLSISAIGLLATSKTIDHSENIEGSTRQGTTFMKNLLLDLEAIQFRVSNDELNEGIVAVIELARFSDPSSNDLTTDVEAQIAELLHDIENEPTTQKLRQLSMLLSERARVCKEGK